MGLPEDKTYYFRTVDFHVAALKHRDEIIKLMPTAKERKELKTIKHSTELGQQMIALNCILKVKCNHKFSKKPIMLEVDPDNTKFVLEQGFWMVPAIAVVKPAAWYSMFTAYLPTGWFGWMWMIYFGKSYIPDWTAVALYQFLFFVIMAFIAIRLLRTLMWYIFYHVGLDFNLLPKFMINTKNPFRRLWPLGTVSVRDDICSPKSLLIRIISIALICMSIWKLSLDAKSIEDLS